MKMQQIGENNVIIIIYLEITFNFAGFELHNQFPYFSAPNEKDRFGHINLKCKFSGFV